MRQKNQTDSLKRLYAEFHESTPHRQAIVVMYYDGKLKVVRYRAISAQWYGHRGISWNETFVMYNNGDEQQR